MACSPSSFHFGGLRTPLLPPYAENHSGGRVVGLEEECPPCSVLHNFV